PQLNLVDRIGAKFQQIAGFETRNIADADLYSIPFGGDGQRDVIEIAIPAQGLGRGRSGRLARLALLCRRLDRRGQSIDEWLDSVVGKGKVDLFHAVAKPD